MMRALGIVTILRGFEVNVPGQMKALHPTANISKVHSGTEWYRVVHREKCRDVHERSTEWYKERGT